MANKAIEFMLVGGKIPSFVIDYFSEQDNSKGYCCFLGVTCDSTTDYIPDSIIVLTPTEFVERVKLLPFDGMSLTKKTKLASDLLTKYGLNV